MKNTLYIIRALHPPILLALLSFFVFSICLGNYMILYGIGILLAGIFSFDAFNRYIEMKATIKHIKDNKKELHIIFKGNEKTWCTREATKGACKFVSEKIYIKAKKFYRERGFKPYHFFPVNTFTKNSPFIKLSFYKKTLLGFLKKKK